MPVCSSCCVPSPQHTGCIFVTVTSSLTGTGSLAATQAQARLVAAQEAVLLTGRDLKTAQQAYDVTAADFVEAVDYADAVALQVSCSNASATAVLRVVPLDVTLFCLCLRLGMSVSHW